jgi:Lrp/AsnC family leucine-responsive transcriptional regulator
MDRLKVLHNFSTIGHLSENSMDIEGKDGKKFDAHDQKILRILLADSRRTLQDIGREVGLSTTSCWNRIKRMEDSGAIQGYTIKVDLAQIGYQDTVIVQVTLESHTDETLYEFGRALESIPEVLEAFLISGDYDYFIRIAVKDTRDYERLLRERLYKIPGIRHSKSSFVLRTLKKSDTPLTS